jgi:hypothetical protein
MFLIKDRGYRVPLYYVMIDQKLSDNTPFKRKWSALCLLRFKSSLHRHCIMVKASYDYGIRSLWCIRRATHQRRILSKACVYCGV